MIQNERLNKILDLLEKEKFCTTESLAKRLYVVPITIRRDLKLLEQDGLITRCHGGASIMTHDNRNVPYIVRENSNNHVKLGLAKEAVKYIHTGDTVLLDASSTASFIAERLPTDRNLTVITNSIKVCEILSNKSVKTYCIGGRLVENSYAFVGSVAEEALSGMSANVLFFSSQGISEKGVISDFSEEETQLRRRMLACAERKYFVCDSSKIGKEFLFHVCSFQDIDGIICDKELCFE